MAAIHSGEFKRDAVRIGLTSGLTRRQVPGFEHQSFRIELQSYVIRAAACR